jgi:hypothetical protein
MPELDGLEATRQILDAVPDTILQESVVPVGG